MVTLGFQETGETSIFSRLRDYIRKGDPLETVRRELVGKEAEFPGKFGVRKLVYADYVASGRALHVIEKLVLEDVLPYYANTHTESSFVGSTMTELRNNARREILSLVNGSEDHAVIFTGSGATSGVNRVVHLWQLKESVARGEEPVVFVGPYEHHSNLLPWRESGAEVIEIRESADGGPCLHHLRGELHNKRSRKLKIGAFSAASNVTGILTDVETVTRALKEAGALAFWDYAGAGPYVDIDFHADTVPLIDAVALSPHKFIGGPGASGLLIVKRSTVSAKVPTLPGGGSVSFVSSSSHTYSTLVERREEAGTPNVIGDLRAALCMVVKDAIGGSRISERNELLSNKAIAAWGAEPQIELLGNTACKRLPIFSFRIKDGIGGFFHYDLVGRMLSDVYGIQSRSGCACAGPYGHRLLNIDEDASSQIFAAIMNGDDERKPGFTRLNLSFAASDSEVDFIINSVLDLAREAPTYARLYSGT